MSFCMPVLVRRLKERKIKTKETKFPCHSTPMQSFKKQVMKYSQRHHNAWQLPQMLTQKRIPTHCMLC